MLTRGTPKSHLESSSSLGNSAKASFAFKASIFSCGTEIVNGLGDMVTVRYPLPDDWRNTTVVETYAELRFQNGELCSKEMVWSGVEVFVLCTYRDTLPGDV